MQVNTILTGDALDVLSSLPDAFVQVCVTSPPYYGLRSYLPEKHADKHLELGLEETPESYIERLVAVFREVKRVLRPDGTLWVNIGDSFPGSGKGQPQRDTSGGFSGRDKGTRGQQGYSNASGSGHKGISSNFLNCFQSLVKGQPLIFGNATTIGIAPKSGKVTLYDDGFPYGVLLSLLGIERVTIKQRDNDFCQVFHILNDDGYCRISFPIYSMSMNVSDLEIVFDAVDNLSIIISNSNADTQPILSIQGVSSMRSGKESDSSLSIEETAKPVSKCIRDVELVGDAVTFNTPLKRFPDIYLVDDTVALRNRFDSATSYGGHFRITQASHEQICFRLDNCGVNISSSMVTQMFSPNSFGSLVCYSELYDKAQRKSNTLRAKQELGIPFILRQALMEDGWICRSTIIWHKPNCMPESVTDRPTKSHEYLFLLAKNERYYYDGEAIREEACEASLRRIQQPNFANQTGGPKDYRNGINPNRSMRQTLENFAQHPRRNKRSVWTIPTTPFSGAVLLADYVGTDGRPYKVSEDCPIHGQRRDIRIRQKVGYGEQQDHSERHIFDMSSHLVQEPEVECLSTPCLVSQDCVSESVHRQNLESTHDYRNGEHSHSVGLQTGHDTVHIPERDAYNSGSPDQPCSELAIDHNTQNYRMGLALETNLAYTSCVETVGCTADMSELPLWSGLDGCKNESNTLLDGLNGHPLEQKSSRIAGKSSAKSSSLAYVHGNTAKCTCQVVSIDHFATFPPTLVEPCILAGSRPGDIVLDPFAGAGTTLMVAIKHGRNYVGIELNPAYVELAEQRISVCQPNLWTSQGVA